MGNNKAQPVRIFYLVSCLAFLLGLEYAVGYFHPETSTFFTILWADLFSGIKLVLLFFTALSAFTFITEIRQNRFPEALPDGRRLIAGAILVYTLLIICSQLLFRDYGYLLNYLGVPAHKRFLFNDIRVITAALDCCRTGHDPLLEGSCSPNLIYNYPRLWYLLQYTGIGERHTLMVACISIVVFVLSLFTIIGKPGFVRSLYWMVVIISPPVVLAVERCNNDIILFSVLTAALVLVNKEGIRKFAGYFLILLGTLLKLYPLFAAIVLLRESRSNRLKAGLLIVIPVLLYLLLGYNELLKVYLLSPKPSGTNAFGAYTWMDNLNNYFRFSEYIQLSLILVSLALMIAAPVFSIYHWNRSYTPAPNSITLDSFRIGAAIYMGCFILGNNFDYRLIFLIFMVPQLMEWYRQQEKNRTTVTVLLVAIVLLMQYNFVFRHLFPGIQECYAKDILSWTIFMLSTYLFVGSIHKRATQAQ